MATTFTEHLDRIGERVANRYQELPPPIIKSKAETSIYPRYYTEKATQWVEQVFDEAQAQVNSDEEVKESRRYIDILMGKHWPADRPLYKARPVINKMSKFFWETIAYLTDLRINPDIVTENEAYKELAGKLKIAVQANWRNERAIVSIIYACMHAMLGGGYIKVGPHRDKDDITYRAIGSDYCFPILGDPNNIQLSGGMIDCMWKPVSWFREKFPGVGEQVRGEASQFDATSTERPANVPEYTWNALSPGFRRALFGPSEVASGNIMQRALYSEYFFRDPQINTSTEVINMGTGNWSYKVHPGQRIYPYGRLICTGNRSKRTILYDGPNFHWHALFPYAFLRLQPVPWSFSGISDFRDLWPINFAIDQVVADGLDLQKQALNPTVVTQMNAIPEESWKKYFPGLPGQKLVVNPRFPIDQVIKWVEPPIGVLGTIPPFYQMLKDAFDEQAGTVDANRLSGKKQVPSSSTIEQIRDSQQGKYRVKGIFLEIFTEDVSRLALSDIIQFYTRKRTIQLLGKGALQWQHFDYDPGNLVPHSMDDPFVRGREFVRQFNLCVVAGSALPEQRRRMAEMGVILRARRDLSRKSLYNLLDLAGYPLPDAGLENTELQAEVAPVLPRTKGVEGAPLPG